MITDEELDMIYGSPLDLYRWSCAVPGCQHWTKVWRVNNCSHILVTPAMQVVPVVYFAWLHRSQMRWVDDTMFLLCHKHKHNHSLVPDNLDCISKFTLLKTGVYKRHRQFSIIQKINK